MNIQTKKDIEVMHFLFNFNVLLNHASIHAPVVYEECRARFGGHGRNGYDVASVVRQHGRHKFLACL